MFRDFAYYDEAEARERFQTLFHEAENERILRKASAQWPLSKRFVGGLGNGFVAIGRWLQACGQFRVEA